jgi:hypothetical protein
LAAGKYAVDLLAGRWVIMKKLLTIAVILCQLGLLVACSTPTSVHREPMPPTPPMPTGLPVINSFNASPSSISLGDSTGLSWNVSNATAVYISNGVGNVDSSGSTIVSPPTTTTYILAASNANGILTAHALVQVSDAPSPHSGLPVINYFTASPTIVLFGSSTLGWNVSNATHISITPGIGNVEPVGSTSVWVGATTTYILTASNLAGTVYDTVTVTRKRIRY